MAYFKRPIEHENESDEGHYYISISDLMTSLLFIFILILTYVMLSFIQKEDNLTKDIIKVEEEKIKVEEKVKELEKIKDEQQKKEDLLSNKIKMIEQNIEYRGELLQNLQNELLGKDINVEIDKENGNMRLKSDLLFTSGSADISIEGQRQIGEIAKLLMTQMVKKKYKMAIDTIFIEGHTDSVPIKGSRDYKSNKELSAQRAINTYSEMLLVTNNKISELKNKKGKHLLSYSGYASTRPLYNETEVGLSNKELKAYRSKNRRIEFYFTVNTPDVQKMKEAIDD